MGEQRHTCVVAPDDTGKRLDVYLAERDFPLTRSVAKTLIVEGRVAVNGAKVKASHHVRAGETIDVTIPQPHAPRATPEDIPLDIIYEDADLIVVNKRASMVVHPAAGNFSGTLVNALLAHCKDLSGIGGELKPGIVHRLDKGTSGVIVAAKNDAAHVHLSQQFKDRLVTKIYGALVYGAPKALSGRIDAPIGRARTDRKKMSTHTKKGRIALTEWRVAEGFGSVAWLEVKLGTGRTHQIRVHLADIGHPLVGDATYGRGGAGRIARGEVRDIVAAFPRPALHAWRLGFTHPRTGAYREFIAPLPEDITCVLAQLRCQCRR